MRLTNGGWLPCHQERGSSQYNPAKHNFIKCLRIVGDLANHLRFAIQVYGLCLATNQTLKGERSRRRCGPLGPPSPK